MPKEDDARQEIINLLTEVLALLSQCHARLQARLESDMPSE